jgi:hypothetical protein
MAVKNINISDLTFEGIRSSLLDYLRTQDVFKDYDFEGSAIRTIVDLLAYNTFYYGYYSNMIANEMFLDTAKLENSMISLTKPLGYLVSKYSSSRSSIRMAGLGVNTNSLSPFSVFKGFSVSGRPYFFYTVKSVNIRNNNGVGETEYFDLFEGRTITRRQLVSVNLDTQSFTLVGDNIDPKTIVIEVQKTEGEDFVEWINYVLNPDSIVGPNTEIFFVERSKNGYVINFGKQTSSDISSSSTGKMIEQGNKVYVSFLTSSGEGANGISSFVFQKDGNNAAINTTNSQITVLYPSKNGRSTPDLDEIRFFAPKSFAKQNRLVTKNDYYVMLNELGYGSSDNPDFSYKVFGGEEATPPVYGRVFVSLIDLNLNDDSNFSQKEQINEIISVLKNKSVVSILPEYVPPLEYSAKIRVVGSVSNLTDLEKITAKQSLTNAIYSAYSTKKYNQNIIEDDIIDLCRTTVPGIQLSTGGIFVTIIANAGASENQRKINFKNTIDSIEITHVGSTNLFKNDGKFIYEYNGNSKIGEPVGELVSNEGVVVIYQNKLPNAITISAIPTNDIFYSKDEIVCRVVSVSDVTVTVT